MNSFADRAAQVPVRGIGLSVELYDPPLPDLLAGFAAAHGAVAPEYVEIYRAVTDDLREFRRGAGAKIACEYHADGLWMVQPGYIGSKQYEAEIQNIQEQSAILGNAWANHECATKQLYGHTFGSFVSPLLTNASARAIAANAAVVYEEIEPLLLLETASYSYWSSGGLRLSEFFAEIYRDAPCGICLDIGHVYTWFQLERARTGIASDKFLSEWLDVFPLDRVIEMHVAGSRVERPDDPALQAPDGTRLVDHHPSTIPPIYLEWIEAHLRHPRLTNLRGVAFEVDGKSIQGIVDEFQTVVARVRGARSGFGPRPAQSASHPALSRKERGAPAPNEDSGLEREYRRYIAVLSGNQPPNANEGPARWVELERDAIRECYFRMRGGELDAVFPETCELLRAGGVEPSAFDAYFERSPAFEDASFDFFRLVVRSFQQWVRSLQTSHALELRETADREASFLLGEQEAARV